MQKYCKLAIMALNASRRANMLLKLFIVMAFAFVVYNLGRALYFLFHDHSDGSRTAQALTWRIGLSIALFIFVLLALTMGWIHPHGINLH
jgi:lipopolysaccharide export LptBFGC system permease protein LptF